jgi:predicted nicotinamide N-methyase
VTSAAAGDALVARRVLTLPDGELPTHPADLPAWLVARVDFFLANTSLGSTPQLPEIVLRLGAEAVPLWHAIEREFGAADGKSPPYWGFAWPGGQAVARYVLDHPSIVAGRRVLDLASGSGVVAIAAAKAGALHVVANDIDQLAVVAIAMNADANGVAIAANAHDLVRDGAFDCSAFDVVLAGDIFYDHDLAIHATAFLQRCRAAGSIVLVGDPGRAALPRQILTKRSEYPVPVAPENQYTAAETRDDRHSVLATVWELESGNAGAS